MKTYSQRPEVKARAQARYRSRAEEQRAYPRAYYQQPEVKARKLAY